MAESERAKIEIIRKSEGARICNVTETNWKVSELKVPNFETVIFFKVSDSESVRIKKKYQKKNFEILTLSDSDTSRFCAIKILTLCNSDTFIPSKGKCNANIDLVFRTRFVLSRVWKQRRYKTDVRAHGDGEGKKDRESIDKSFRLSVSPKCLDLVRDIVSCVAELFDCSNSMCHSGEVNS